MAPALDQHTTRPSVSAMVICVLLKVAAMCTIPCGTMRRSRFFLNSFLRFAGAAAPAFPVAACLSGRVAWSGAAFCSFATFDSVSLIAKNSNYSRLAELGRSKLRPYKSSADGLALLAGDLLLGSHCAAARAFAGARVGVRALTAHRKISAVPNAAISLHFNQAADVHLDFLAEIAFHAPFFFNFLAQTVGFVFGQVADLLFNIHVGLGGQALRARAPDAIDGGEAHPEAFLRWKIDTCDTCHMLSPLILLSLALLVLRVAANYADYPAAVNHLALVANFLDACPYF